MAGFNFSGVRPACFTSTVLGQSAAGARVLRNVDGLTRRDRVRNEIRRNNLEVQSLFDNTDGYLIHWFSHVRRTRANRLPKIIME